MQSASREINNSLLQLRRSSHTETMSTKIYTGFYLATRNWSRIHDWCIEYRAEIAAKIQQKLCADWAERTCATLDRRALGLETVTGPAYFVAENEVTKGEPPSCSLVLIPHRRKTYGIAFGSESYMAQMWLNRDYVEDYSYWNNTDQPDHVTARNWNARAALWDRLIGWDPPSMRGFTVQCAEIVWPMIRPEDLMAAMPPLQKRASIAAKDELFADWTKEHLGESTVGEYMKFHNWMLSDKGQKVWSVLAKELQSRLPASYTRADVMQ